MKDTKEQNYESFLKLYRANENHIFRFILALLPNYSAAEDIMQDTMLVMWRKFDQYETGSNFAAWGMQIARYAVLKFHRKNKNGIVHFDSDALNNIISYEKVLYEKDKTYFEALEECTKSLQENSKQIITLRYVENMKITDIALQMGKTLNATYKAMSRIHHSLLNCIERRISKEKVV